MEKMKWIKKGISVLLALNMVLSSVPLPAFAATTDNLCDHHTEHTAECGYVEAVEGRPCTHVHDELCGYVEAVEGVSCDCESAEDGTLTHTDGCGYVEAVAGSPCAHVHDELCGYAEAVEGQPCGYECGECAAAAEAYSDLGIGYICAAGNGDIGLGSWVNGEGWNILAESNIMTEVAANVYEITYTDLPASDNYKLQFVADGVWTNYWGGTYIGSGVESDAELGGSVISFPVSREGSDVTLKLDLTDWDPATTYGAKFTITVIPPEDVPVCTCEDKCVEGSVNSDCAVCAENVNGCTGREEAGYTYDEETKTYTVYTADGLFAVAELINGGAYSANITLAADIVLNENLADKVTVAEDGTVSADASVRTWMPLGGTFSGEYNGTFDGGNHTITGLYCVPTGYGNPGLISVLAEGATVKNVKIHDFCLERNGGAVVGSNRGEVSGCSISGTGILGWTTNYQYVGGVVGVNESTVKDCTSSAALTFRGMGYFGGIVGYNMISQATIIGCSNSGTITAAGSSEMNVGGIAGWVEGTVTGCYNTGTVSSNATGDNSCANVGGIAGNADGTVSGCYNTAAVSGDATGDSSYVYVGGIAGNADGTVSGCYNTAAVSGDATGDYSYAHGGGIVGSTYGTVSGCYNIGSIDSGTYSGGIAAIAHNGTFADCYYLDTCVESGNIGSSSADGITEKSEAQFASGEVAYALNGDQSTITFKQTIGTDAAPNFTGGTVYQVGVTCTEGAEAYANTQSNLDHNYTDGICTLCGIACDHSGSTHTAVTDKGDGTHGYACTVCGAAATGAHTFDKNGSCICGLRAYVYDKSTITYTVYNAEGLFAVVELVNGGAYSANITLAADIVLNENLADKVTVAEDGTVSADDSVRKWMAIAEAGSWAYSGTFDGGGHTITGLYSVEGPGTYGGLIEWLDSEGTVTNLKIRDFCLEGTYSGAIAGENKGKIIGCSISGTGIFNGSPKVCGLFGGIVSENLGQVTDCSISANLSLKGAGEFGGIAYSNGQDASITGCSNSGTLTGTAYVGGIVSHNYGTVTGCSNSGTLTGTECVGGIVGSSDGTVSGCYNTGTVIGKAMAETSEPYVGGIAGNAVGPVSGCYNTGNVSGDATGESAYIYVGGIAGNAVSTVTGCHNTGNISGDATGDSSYAYVGGIAGFVNNTVSGCYNTADVSGDATGESAYIYVGGIAGVAEGTMSGCYNIGSIDSDTYSGSIAAYAYGTYADCFYLSGCVKSGNPEYSSSEGITEKSAAQFASGEVAYLLNGDQSTITFKQTLGTDAYPGFTGGTVYQVENCKEEPVYSNTNENIGHQWVNGTCTVCDLVCDHSGSTHTAATDNGDGTHGYACTVCGAAVTEAHAMDVTTGKCGECGAAMTAIATVTDGTNTCYAADAATLNQAVTEILETGSRTFTVELPADAEAGMITAIRRAICDTDGVADGSIYLTLKGVTSIPGTTNWDGVAFGPGDIYDEAGEIVDQELVTQLASINLPDVTEIGAQAFYHCENLVTVSAPKAQTIGAQAFGYTALTSVEFPELTTIPTDMFIGTWTLSSAKFPKVTTIEQNGLLIGANFKPENNPTPFPLELTAEGDITFNGSNHFNIADYNYSGKVDLVLCCDKKDAVTFHDDGTATWQVREDLSYTFKSITFKQHSYVDGKCTACGEVCDHTGGTATCTAPAVCIICGTGYGEKKPHSFNDSGFCTVCNTAAQAKLVAKSDGTVTYFATLPEALAAEHNAWDKVYALADYEGDITVPAGLCFYGENHTFSGDVLVEGGRIFSGTFNGEVQVYLLDTVEEGIAQGFIYGGTFRKAVFVGSQCFVYGGTFEAELELGGSDVCNFAGDEYHITLGENFTLMLYGDTTIDCQEHFEPLGFDCTVGKLCRLCRYALTDPQAAHTGSNSTCSTEGACQVCGTLYLDPDVHANDCTNGIWTCCGKYQIPEQDADGVYEIDNAGKLFWFAAQVNSGNTALNARLTADIDLENRPWTPIGNNDSYYEGIFDGSGKTIKGLNIPDEAAEHVGLFGKVYPNGHVKAVTLTESSVTGAKYVGGIAGWNMGTVTGCVNNAVVSNSGFDTGGIAGYNTGTVELCGNTNTVTGSSESGGIVGRNNGTIRNCYNTGEVHATDKAGAAGGITDLNTGTVEYSWSTGEVTGGSNGEEGGIAADNRGTVRYCCATQKAIDSNQSGSTTNNVGTYTAAQFASGEVAYMLSSASEGEPVWGQTIGTDPYPVLGGAQVYHGYTSCGDTAAIYTNDETVSPEKPPHTGEADYTPTADGKHHIAKWSCCGTEVTEAHSGGTATCQTLAVCQHCGESYGELDPNNHEYETNNGICCDTYQSATLNAEGYYEIFNAGQLYWFAQQVNGGSYGLNAKLVNNITLNENLLNDSYALNSGDFRTWTPMGDFFHGYSGTFDGQGYVISGLYIPSTNTIQGMFSVVTGTVKNVILADTYVQGAGQDGGLVGYLRGGTVSNCGFDGVVKSVASGGSAGSYTAGVVAYAYGGTIENCFATGKIHSEGDHANPVFAYADTNGGAPTLTNNYYLENCSTDSTGTVNAVHCNDGVYATTEAQIASVTQEQIRSGEVAYLLGGAWGQTIGTDSYPVLGGAKVYEIKVCEKTAYSNTEGDVPHDYVNGFCTATPGEIHYQPAPDSDSDGFFEIGNAGQLFWFANHINTVDRTASAVLTADIDLEGRPWTPIGSTGESSNNFRGTFDGQNHTIRGLYVEGGRAGLGFFGEVRTGTVKNFTIYGEVVANTEVNYVGGVFGSICGLNGENDLERNGAVIQNITSYVNLTAKVHGIGMIGGFVGYANHQSLIENCAWYGTFDAGIYRVDTGAGGFIGKIQENTSEVTIRNCGAYGTIKTNYAKNSYNNTPTIYMGGFLSFSNTNAKTTLENCLFAGRFERGANLTDQAFLGAFGTLRSVNAIKNCYYLGDDGLEAVHSDSNLKPGSDNVEIKSVTGEQLLSGEIAYKLGSAWGQYIGTQNYPVPGGDKVYQVKNCKQEIAYNNNNENLGHNYVNGICTVCGEACEHTGGTATCTTLAVCAICGESYGEVSTNNHDETVPFSDNGFCPNGCYEPAELVGRYFQITNAGQLYWFAAQVNSGYTNINGELKANIVVNEDVHAEMIRINPDPSRFRLWTPIGTGDNGYSGDFCGLEHTVSGLYFNDSTAYFVGLFGYVDSGTVSHVGVIDSYFNGSGGVGSVVGCNYGTVEYAYNTGTVKGGASVGGVVGDNYSTVKYAYNTGTVSGDFVVGGVVGSNEGTVKYAYNTGSVSGGTDVGGVAGENFDTFATVTNCYFDSTVYTGTAIGTDSGTATDVEGKTGEQFACGEVAYLLGYPFGQTIGTHFSPVLYMGDKVYYGYTSCGDVQMVYTNDPKASTEKPEHTGEATYTLTEDGAQHIAAYSCCGTTVTEDHTYENGFCPCGLYDLWVAGEQISESKLTVTGTTGTATYDPETDTLTLNDFDNGEKWYSFTRNDGYSIHAAVYTVSDLNVVLKGENSLFASGKGYNAAIQSQAALTIGGDGTLDVGTIYSANGTTINGGTLNLAADTVFDGSSTTINGGNVNVHALVAVTFETLTVTGGRVVLETSDAGFGYYGTILIGEGMAVYDESGALIENPDFSTLTYALIQAPCDHTQATASYTWTEDPITLKVTVSCPACGETFTGSTKDMDVTTSDDGFTTTYTATVTLDGKKYTDSKTVTNQVTSVNIAWGSMEFTYTEDETGKGAWSNPDGANRIAVTNTGNTAVTVTAAYTQAEGYEEIEGKFYASENSTHTEPAAAGETAEFYLYLEGEPNKALKNTTVGTVTISIR